MIAIIDYDAGNIKSVEKAFCFLGAQVCVTRDAEKIEAADGVVLPGVGAFGDAMSRLHQYRLVEAIRRTAASGTPFLGICLGMQLLFEKSEESAGVEGLGILKGSILRIPESQGLKVPHIGWNALSFPTGHSSALAERSFVSTGHSSAPCRGRLFEGISEEAYVYFVHSYYLKAEDEHIVAAKTQYGVEIHAAVEKDHVFACQFHPEKSSEVGLRILKNFMRIVAEQKGTI